ncbi:synaptosomal-associated protein 47 [Hyperolius riggenbachi]|uniref:synaptosomal-associated protein 47 n=1 Tax=Hyperolius riggenbachi TaxID=752182 RepID=UPI0035A2E8BB
MNKEVPVQTWPSSYYLTSDRRWVSGRLSLTPTHLRFKLDNAEGFLVNFHLSSISEIKKESSSYIFSSITVLEKDNTKHWFSSLQPNRNVVFTVLEHFWREQLLTRQGEQGNAKTSKGRELVNLVTGSQKRLEDTTRVLHHQGEQFDNILKDLNKIDADMATADRMLSILEAPSWWPFTSTPWKRSNSTSSKEACAGAPNHGKEGIVVTVPIVFSCLPDRSLKPGTLSVLVSSLEVADSTPRLLHRYERQDVDDIKVFTGHEIAVRQRFIGKPDITFRILSAKLPDVLPLLEMQYGKKMEFLEEAAMFSEKWRSSPPDRRSPGWQTDSWLLDTIVKSSPIEGGQAEAVIQDQEVSDSEAQELRKILMKLKSIALEAENKLERQDEALDEITSSVDRAGLSMDKQTRRMRKLL